MERTAGFIRDLATRLVVNATDLPHATAIFALPTPPGTPQCYANATNTGKETTARISLANAILSATRKAAVMGTRPLTVACARCMPIVRMGESVLVMRTGMGVTARPTVAPARRSASSAMALRTATARSACKTPGKMKKASANASQTGKGRTVLSTLDPAVKNARRSRRSITALRRLTAGASRAYNMRVKTNTAGTVSAMSTGGT